MKIVTYQSPLKPQQPVQIPQQPKTTAVFAGWIVLILGFILALIPGIGLSMILISIPVCFASLVLGIYGAAKGKPIRGVLLILSSIVAFFVFQIIPWISSLIGLAAASEVTPK
jgi:hypothetical protein